MRVQVHLITYTNSLHERTHASSIYPFHQLFLAIKSISALRGTCKNYSYHTDHSTPLDTQRQSQQLREIRHAQPRHRIPPFCCVPTRKRDDGAAWDRRSSLAIDTVAADALATGDVCEARVADCVDCGVEN